jgi:hypothetical protein
MNRRRSTPVPAPENTPGSLLLEALATIDQRAQQRDTVAERSMARTVAAFNGLTGRDLTEEEGWLFMATLKLARAAGGRTYHRDDYVDAAAYVALLGERAAAVDTGAGE